MAIHIRRREFIFTLGGAARVAARGAREQPGKVPRIGFLGARLRTVTQVNLRDSGWVCVTRLRRGHDYRDRISMGGGKVRAPSRAGD